MEHAAPNLKPFKPLLCEYYALRVGGQPSTFMICASFSLMAVDTSFVRASMRACTCNQATWKQTRHTTSDRWQRVAGAGGGGIAEWGRYAGVRGGTHARGLTARLMPVSIK